MASGAWPNKVHWESPFDLWIRRNLAPLIVMGPCLPSPRTVVQPVRVPHCDGFLPEPRIIVGLGWCVPHDESGGRLGMWAIGLLLMQTARPYLKDLRKSMCVCSLHLYTNSQHPPRSSRCSGTYVNKLSRIGSDFGIQHHNHNHWRHYHSRFE